MHRLLAAGVAGISLLLILLPLGDAAAQRLNRAAARVRTSRLIRAKRRRMRPRPLLHGARARRSRPSRLRRLGRGPSRWLVRQEREARGRMWRNLSPEGAGAGAVVAAPGGNPEYQFHWVRDAAIAMDEVLVDLRHSRPGAERERLVRTYTDYVNFSARLLDAETQTGAGEPKYRLDGGAFNDPWGRPQNDGPAKRALGNIEFARWLLRERRPKLVPKLFSADEHSLIRADLDYVAQHWRDPSFDIWEEEKGDHFYARLVQQRALSRGAALARSLGDREAARRYKSAAEDISAELKRHWDPEHGILRVTLPGSHKGGIDYKHSGLDVQVILAVLHAGSGGPFKASDERVLSTAHQLEETFRSIYPINHERTGSGPVAMGRYPEDRYTGQPGQDRDDGGNPWVITTHALAELDYRVAAEIGRAGHVTITHWSRPFYLAALGQTPDSTLLPEGSELRRGQAGFGRLRRALIRRGDETLRIIREATPEGGHQREQIDRTGGEMLGADELTWNYASFLSAARARKDAVAAGRAAPRPARSRRPVRARHHLVPAASAAN